MAALKAAGRLGMGLVSDKIGTRPSALFCVLIATAMLFFLLVARQPWMFYAYAIICGFVTGGTFTLLPRIVAEKFGTKSMGAIMGVCAIFVSIGPAMGPVFGAMVYDRVPHSEHPPHRFM
jgi:OFA family oxalate/formate antiporter-like MFS transporter